jgi:hypothetical protein
MQKPKLPTTLSHPANPTKNCLRPADTPREPPISQAGLTETQWQPDRQPALWVAYMGRIGLSGCVRGIWVNGGFGGLGF